MSLLQCTTLQTRFAHLCLPTTPHGPRPRDRAHGRCDYNVYSTSRTHVSSPPRIAAQPLLSTCLSAYLPTAYVRTRWPLLFAPVGLRAGPLPLRFFPTPSLRRVSLWHLVRSAAAAARVSESSRFALFQCPQSPQMMGRFFFLNQKIIPFSPFVTTKSVRSLQNHPCIFATSIYSTRA